MRKYISALLLTIMGYSTTVLATPVDTKENNLVSTPEKLLPAGVDITEAV